MTNFNKLMTKYTKTYIKKIEKSQFTEEEKIVYKTIGLMSVNALIYFTVALEESNPLYTGIQPKKWKIEQKQITEDSFHDILEAITMEYFIEALDSEQALKFDNLEKWNLDFYQLTSEMEEENLIDKVFNRLKIGHVSRNEMPVMTFVNIVSSLFQRIDEALEKTLPQT